MKTFFLALIAASTLIACHKNSELPLPPPPAPLPPGQPPNVPTFSQQEKIRDYTHVKRSEQNLEKLGLRFKKLNVGKWVDVEGPKRQSVLRVHVRYEWDMSFFPQNKSNKEQMEGYLEAYVQNVRTYFEKYDQRHRLAGNPIIFLGLPDDQRSELSDKSFLADLMLSRLRR